MPTHSQFVDLTGQKFGKLTVVEYAGAHLTPSGQKKRLWKCSCDCGGSITVHGSSLKNGNTVSCWCVRRAAAAKISKAKHGHCGNGRSSVEYRAWSAMLGRTNNPDHKQFAEYGGRGIMVCDRWQKFENFMEDMGHRPPGMSLDRIENEGNYEPGNCRWTNSLGQNNNKRDNRRIEAMGESRTIAEWSRISGISHGTISQRLRAGWPNGEAVTKAVRPKRK